MDDHFDKREQALEAMFVHERSEVPRFGAPQQAAGPGAAGKLGKSGDAAEAYAKTV